MTIAFTGCLDALPRTRDVLVEGIERGLHPGAQLFVALGEMIVADAAVGDAVVGIETTRRAMTTDTINLWFSATKPITALCIALLEERGELDLDDRVAATIPEFAANGKDPITLRHILLHTGGFRHSTRSWADEPWDAQIEAISSLPLEEGWVPGERAGYHGETSFHLLGEIVRRVDGRPFPRFVREELFLPLGCDDCFVGMAETDYAGIKPRLGGIYKSTEFAVGAPPRATLWNERPRTLACFPAGGGRGPARDIGRFYMALLREGIADDGKRVLAADTVAKYTARHRVGMKDETFRFAYDWGLGFMLATRIPGVRQLAYDFGAHASPATFGHGGSQSSNAFADPRHGLAVAWVCNGMPGETEHRRRNHAINSAIYADLGLAAD